jgi:hypothetical protein
MLFRTACLAALCALPFNMANFFIHPMKNSKNRRIPAPRITLLCFSEGSILALIFCGYLGLLFHKFSRFPIF